MLSRNACVAARMIYYAASKEDFGRNSTDGGVFLRGVEPPRVRSLASTWVLLNSSLKFPGGDKGAGSRSGLKEVGFQPLHLAVRDAMCQDPESVPSFKPRYFSVYIVTRESGGNGQNVSKREFMI